MRGISFSSGASASYQRFQSPLLGLLGQRKPPRLEGQIDVFENFGVLDRFDLLVQLRGQFALPLDRSKDRLLAVTQLPSPVDRLLDTADVQFIKAAGLIPSVAGAERHGIAFIKQVYRSNHAGLGQAQTLCDPF